jgi:ABC-type glycerol-3-phosphate transport system substrate-binding protein
MKYVRWVVLSMLVLAGAVLLIAGPKGSSGAPDGFVIVHYWEKWVGPEAQKMQEIVTDFNNTIGKEKKIWVQYMSISAIDQKTLVATAAGDPPEIAGLWQQQVAQWGAMEALEDLGPLAEKHGITEKSYKKLFWDACHYKGKLVSLVSTPATIMLHWNKEYFKQRYDELVAAGFTKEQLKGFDGTRAPWTLTEFNDWARLLDKWEPQGSKVKGTLKTAGYIPAEPGWWRTRTTAITFGTRGFNDKEQKFQFNSPQMIKAYEWHASFSQEDWLGPEAVAAFTSTFGQNFATPQNAFMSTKVAMELQGPWMVSFIQSYKPEWNIPKLKGLNKDANPKEWAAATEEYFNMPVEERRRIAGWGIAAFPSVFSDAIVEQGKKEGWSNEKIEEELRKNGAAYCDFDALVIPKGARHKEEAFEFIAYVNSRPAMEKLCIGHGKPTPLTGEPSANWKKNHINPYIEYFDQIAYSPNSQTLPQVPVYTQADEALGNAVDRLTRLIETPKEALDGAQKIAEKKFADFLRREGQ